MEESSQRDITRLLQDWREGDRGALEQLVPLIERDLRRIARQRLGRNGPPDFTLTTTSLVQETYVRLIGRGKVDWQGRASSRCAPRSYAAFWSTMRVPGMPPSAAAARATFRSRKLRSSPTKSLRLSWRLTMHCAS